MSSSSKSALILVLLLASLLVASGFLFIQFGGAAGMAMAGLALCGAIGRAWWLKRPLRRYGQEISHEERPIAYSFCMGALTVFALLVLAAGLRAFV
jgi:hypothetical protein